MSSAGLDRVSERLSAVVPPQNLEAEESVLGAMLLSTTAVGTVSEILGASDFYRERHLSPQVLSSPQHLAKDFQGQIDTTAAKWILNRR